MWYMCKENVYISRERANSHPLFSFLNYPCTYMYSLRGNKKKKKKKNPPVLNSSHRHNCHYVFVFPLLPSKLAVAYPGRPLDSVVDTLYAQTTSTRTFPQERGRAW